ncbi:MAG TPA: cupin domain-containing protein [Blastocatellia bacterium]|nr:cupin domain-containing protein [Blastocatellia bacterium]
MKKKLIITFVVGLLVGVAGTLGLANYVGSAWAEAKSTSKVVLENDRVRVKEAVFAPGDRKPGMHTHEYAHVGVVIDGGTLKFNYPDGKTEMLELKRGGVGYREANVTHEAVNMGNQPIRVIEVEIK